VERDDLIQKYDTVVLELDQVKYKCDRLKLEYERGQKGEAPGNGEKVGREEPAIKKESGDGSGIDGQKLLKEEGDKAALEDKLAGVSLDPSRCRRAKSDDLRISIDRPTGTTTPRRAARS
jgi:hypothetical protein